MCEEGVEKKGVHEIKAKKILRQERLHILFLYYGDQFYYSRPLVPDKQDWRNRTGDRKGPRVEFQTK